MKGTLLIIPVEGDIVATELTEMPHHTELHRHVGGPLETVPYLTNIRWPRISIAWRKCVAFCNEDGKRLELLRNYQAERFWEDALKRAGMPPLEGQDYLVGTIVVLFGDKAFMDAI